MNTAYLSLGSNIGDRQANLTRALKELERSRVRIVRRSSIYETEPVEIREQDWYLNAAVAVETLLEPRELLNAILTIEKRMGRERSVKFGPRLIDLDILLFGDTVVNEEGLSIPHPRMGERRFVLVPLAEIAANMRHPVLGKTIAELLAATTDRSEIQLWQRAP